MRSQWTRELFVLFETVSSLTNTVFLAGDLNADLLASDKQHRDGRALLDLLDIFNLDCLITEPTRKTKTTETLLDLILTNDKKKVLTSGVIDTQLIVRMKITRHTKLSVIPAPLLGERQ